MGSATISSLVGEGQGTARGQRLQSFGHQHIVVGGQSTGFTLFAFGDLMGTLPRIATDRLSLRPFTIMDIDRLHSLWTEANMRRFLWDDVIISPERAADEVGRSLENAARYGIGYWIIEALKKDDLLGFCGFRLIDQGRHVELMYGLERAYWGRGLATEASRGILAWLWTSTSYQRVFARTDPPNQRSIAVMQRLGMKFDSASPTLISYVLDRTAPVEGGT